MEKNPRILGIGVWRLKAAMVPTSKGWPKLN